MLSLFPTQCTSVASRVHMCAVSDWCVCSRFKSSGCGVRPTGGLFPLRARRRAPGRDVCISPSYGRSSSGTEQFHSNPGVESLAKRVEKYLSEGTPGVHGACVACSAHHANSEERASPTRVPELKVNPAGRAPCDREIGVHTSAPLVWWR